MLSLFCSEPSAVKEGQCGCARMVFLEITLICFSIIIHDILSQVLEDGKDTFLALQLQKGHLISQRFKKEHLFSQLSQEGEFLSERFQGTILFVSIFRMKTSLASIFARRRPFSHDFQAHQQKEEIL